MNENRLNESGKEKLRALFSEKGYLQKPVSNQMYQQWEEVASSDVSDLAGKRIWKGIKRKFLDDTAKGVSRYYKIYSIAATIALLIVTAGLTYYMNSPTDGTYMYVVNTGVKAKETVTLPDGTIVTMGPGSKLSYPAKFKNDGRNVSIEGQGFFQVAKDKDRPFIVEAGCMHVKALGTAFEVFNYADNELAETILETGKVEVVFKREACEQKLVLMPNDKVCFNKDNLEYALHKLDARKAVAWHNDEFLSFEKASLFTIFSRLEQWYGRKIHYNVEQLPTVQFSFKVRDESIEDIFYLMNQSIKLDFKKTGEDYELTIE